MPHKVILDMDPGVDDAVALCFALAEPKLEVVAVTATGGNIRAEQATRNVQAIIERIDPPRWPRLGAADPRQPLCADAHELHGPFGLGSAEIPVAEMANHHPSVKLIADEVRKAPGEITLIGTGPWTNLAAVLTREPQVAEDLRGVLALGGSVSAGGNVTPAAEFNVYCNPEAARQVFHSAANTTVLPVDITQQMFAGYDFLEFVRSHSSRTTRLLAEMLPGFYRAYRQRFAMEGICLHDVAAIVAVAYPELVSAEPMHGDVETAGELTLGATIFDRRSTQGMRPNVEVITALDIPKTFEVLRRGLENAV